MTEAETMIWLAKLQTKNGFMVLAKEDRKRIIELVKHAIYLEHQVKSCCETIMSESPLRLAVTGDLVAAAEYERALAQEVEYLHVVC